MRERSYHMRGRRSIWDTRSERAAEAPGKSTMSTKLAALVLVAATAAPAAGLASPAQDAAGPRSTAIETVWVKGKDEEELVERVNRMHAEMAAKGYRYASLSTYAKSGVVIGLLVTYVRD